MTTLTRRPLRRLTGMFLVVSALLMITATGAGADGVGPTNYRSEIRTVTPPTKGVEFKVIGSDAFLEVRAQPGVRVQIPGYDGEPYLKIDANSSIWRNRNSAATYVNESRSGRGGIPDNLETEPDWQRVGSDGVVAWHDHRIHWMTDEVPATDRSGLVSEWTIPIVVNGVETTVTGGLYRSSNIVPWPFVIAMILAVATFLLARRQVPRVVPLAVLIGSIAAVMATLAVRSVDPPGSGASSVPLALSVLAVACSALSFLPVKRPPIFHLAVTLGAGALLLGWMIGSIGAFWMPYVPSLGPNALTRMLVATTLGLAVGTIVTVLVDPRSVDPNPPEPRATGWSRPVDPDR